jgi:pilus assembly protein CpaB
VPDTSPVLSAWLAQLRAELRWHRRSVLVGLVALAVLVAVNAAHTAGRREPVLVAAHELTAGQTLRATDVVVVQRLPGEVPEGALRAPPTDARTVALPIRRGEVLTDVRLLGPGLLSGLGPGAVAVPVHLSDPAGADLVRVGDTVDVLASGEGGSTVVAAAAARVLRGVQPSTSRFGRTDDAATVVLAVDADEAAALARAAVASHLSLVLRTGRDPPGDEVR